MSEYKAYLKNWEKLLLDDEVSNNQSESLGFKKETLELYQSFVKRHYKNSLSKMFPRLSELIEFDWSEVSKDYFSLYPPKAWDLNDLTVDFPEYLESNKDKFGLEDFHIELATYELMEFYAYKSKVEKKDNEKELFLNSSTHYEQFEYDIAQWVRDIEQDDDFSIKPKKETNLLFIARNLDTDMCVFTKVSSLIGVIFSLIENEVETVEVLLEKIEELIPGASKKSITDSIEFMKKQWLIL